MAVVQGEITVSRHADGRIEVTQAPDIGLFSLELLASADPVVFVVRGREITIGGQVTYRVTGWDDIQSCLVAQRIGESR
jgi:hypothetical protein